MWAAIASKHIRHLKLERDGKTGNISVGLPFWCFRHKRALREREKLFHSVRSHFKHSWLVADDYFTILEDLNADGSDLTKFENDMEYGEWCLLCGNNLEVPTDALAVVAKTMGQPETLLDRFKNAEVAVYSGPDDIEWVLCFKDQKQLRFFV